MEIQRSELIDRVRYSGSRLVTVIAPAGYGKSTFARQLAAAEECATVCDLAGVRDGLDLMQRVVAALAASRPEQSDAISLARVSLGSDLALWATYARDAWLEAAPPSVVIFENAEALQDVADAMSLLREPLRLHQRMAVFCSRSTLDLPYGRGLSPSDVLLIRQDDLRFTRNETDLALAGLDASVRDEVDRVSRGWPVVVSLIGRLARSGASPERLAELDRIVHDHLYEYLASELISALSPEIQSIAAALAAIPGATERDIARAVGRDAGDDIRRAVRDLPIAVDQVSGTLDLHPMVAQMLRKKHPTLCETLLRSAALRAAGEGDDVRAAWLYLQFGDARSAASVLKDAGAYMMSTPYPALAAVLSALDEATLMEFPALWCAAIYHRGYSMAPYDWLRHARHVWDHLPADAPIPLRDTVLSALINGYTNPGRCREASDLLDRFEASGAPIEPTTRILILCWRAFLDSCDGRYARIAWYTQEIMPMLEASPLTHALYLYDVVGPMLQARGEWARVEETMARSRALAATNMLAASILPSVETVFVAWFQRDDAAFAQALSDLEALVKRLPWTIRGHSFFIACARGQGRGVPYGYEKVKTRAQALLIASALSTSIDDAVEFARAAVHVADESSRRLLRVLSRVALAELVPQERDTLLEQTAEIATHLESEPMRQALVRVRRRDVDSGILTPFVDRFRAFGTSPMGIEIRVLSGTAIVNGKTVRLAPADFALLAEIAQDRRWFDSAEIAEDLFSDLDGDTAANRLYVAIHRLRRRIHPDVVVGGKSGYRIGPGVSVDLWEAEAVVSCVTLGQAITSQQIRRMETLLPLKRAEIIALAARAGLPEELEYRLTEARRRLLTAAAAGTYQGGELNAALRFAEALLADDAGDEDGRAYRSKCEMRMMAEAIGIDSGR